MQGKHIIIIISNAIKNSFISQLQSVKKKKKRNKNYNNSIRAWLVVLYKIPEVVPDVQPDAVRDVQPDVVPDVELDVVPDVEPDVESDVVPDAVPYVQPGPNQVT